MSLLFDDENGPVPSRSSRMTLAEGWDAFDVEIGEAWVEATDQLSALIRNPESTVSDKLEAIQALTAAGWDDDPRPFLALWERLQRTPRKPCRLRKRRQKPSKRRTCPRRR